jgi:hypothetical protein
MIRHLRVETYIIRTKRSTAMAATIINLTPHSLTIVDPASTTFNADIRKNVCTGDPVVIATIPSAGVASAKIATVADDKIGDVPVFRKQITGCDPLPDIPDAVFVVSALYASAYRQVNGNTDRLYTVADPVYSADGRTILGSLGICPAF